MTFIKDTPFTYEYIACWFCLPAEVPLIERKLANAGVPIKKVRRSFGYSTTNDYLIPADKEDFVLNFVHKMDVENFNRCYGSIGGK